MLKAQDALDNAFEAINDLECGAGRWKSSWITAVTELRSVGHILEKVDSKVSAVARKVIKEHWDEWREKKDGGTWFTEFIDSTRNTLLKEGAGLPTATYISHGEYDEYTHWQLTMDDGADGVPILREAAEWLQDELESIEEEIEERSP